MCTAMEIVVGTYEELILGYHVAETATGYNFQSSFSDHSHTGSVKAVAVSNSGFLASGSSDETIKLFNLGSTRCEVGTLMKHSGTINGLLFHEKTHMFSYSEDGTICIWKTSKWDCLRTLHCHKSPVKSVSIHPSGKMALSVSKDKALRIWNLMTAKCAYTTKMKEEPDLVAWSPDGNSYLVVKNNTVDIYDVKTAAILHTVMFSTRVNAAEFIESGKIAIGGEGGIVEIHDLTTRKLSLRFSTDTNRVKGLTHCLCPRNQDVWLFTISSDGFLKLWRVEPKRAQLLAAVDTKFRPISLALSRKTPQTETPVEVEVKAEPVEEADSQSSEEDVHVSGKKSPQAVEESQSKRRKKLKRKSDGDQTDNSIKKLRASKCPKGKRGKVKVKTTKK